jgi:hypothetical protein
MKLLRFAFERRGGGAFGYLNFLLKSKTYC